MIGRRSEIRLEDRFSRRGGVPILGGLESDEDGINFLENLRVIELHGPAMLCLIVVIEDAEAVRRFVFEFVAVAAPGGVDELAVRGAFGREVKGVKDQGLPLCIEGATKG